MERVELEHALDILFLVLAGIVLHFDPVDVLGHHSRQKGAHHCDHRCLHVAHPVYLCFIDRRSALRHITEDLIAIIVENKAESLLLSFSDGLTHVLPLSVRCTATSRIHLSLFNLLVLTQLSQFGHSFHLVRLVSNLDRALHLRVNLIHVFSLFVFFDEHLLVFGNIL